MHVRMGRHDRYLQYDIRVIEFLSFLCVAERPSKLFGFVFLYWALFLYFVGKCF